MKNFFKDDNGNVSMGRLLSFSLFLICTSIWIYHTISATALSAGDIELIKWGWISAIGSKLASKFAEK